LPDKKSPSQKIFQEKPTPKNLCYIVSALIDDKFLDNGTIIKVINYKDRE